VDILFRGLAVVVILVCGYFGVLSLLQAVVTYLAEPASNPESDDPKSSLVIAVVLIVIATVVGEWAFDSSVRSSFYSVFERLVLGLVIVTGVLRFVLGRLGYLRR
jgi:hypothetical protein